MESGAPFRGPINGVRRGGSTVEESAGPLLPSTSRSRSIPSRRSGPTSVTGQVNRFAWYIPLCLLVFFLLEAGLPGLVRLLPIGIVQASGPLELRLGIPEDLYTSMYEEELKPIGAYLSAQGIRLTIVRSATAATLSSLLMQRGADIGVYTPVGYVRQKQRFPALEPFASHVINGTRVGQSYVLVREDSGITSLEGLRGKRFAFTDADSFAGYYYPRYAMWKGGVDPGKLASNTPMTGHYQESLRLLSQGMVDGAAVLDEVLRLGEVEGIPQRTFRVIAKSRRVPYMAYVARPDLPESTRAELRRLLTGHRFKTLYLHVRSPLELPGPWARITPRKSASWNINGFVTVHDRDYDDVRRVLNFLETLER